MSKEEPSAGKTGSDAEQQADRQFGIQKIYIRDVSFETPNSPGIFTEQWEPKVSMELGTNGQQLADNVHEVVLTITVTVKVKDKTAYLVEVQQAGVFNMMNFPEKDLKHALGSFCPNILFPYAREAISDLVTKGGFPQLLLAPVNFDALFAQHMQQMQKGQQQAPSQADSSPVH